ncbi:alpha-L-rhamnosidase [Caulobacter sp. RL271]|uniref:alpha-L-rhamnosidase n=1 Tax=Caulobacter segnis TaxID=88688 RepID=A0ABY4ZPN5_9CAUL|nr:alpha-L-rhamnosidase [Caulobacter segnis]USQ94757.1 glycoside hydrolase family 78 protein [Caulobacter segnis]
MTGPTRRDALSGAAALAACLTAGSARAATALTAPERLTSEHAAGPIGLEAARPRLAWTPPVARQSAWRVQVAASEADLLAGRLTWDSGKVADATAVEAVYAGPPLPARARRVWRVRLWDGDGRPGAWSAPAGFEMGLLAPRDWGEAAWIGRHLAPPRGWADLTLAVDFTLKGRFFDVLFRARPEGKTYGEAYTLRVGMVDDVPSLMLQVRQYPGGASPQVKLKRLQVWPLAADLKGQRRRLTIEARGTALRFSLDGVLIGALDDATQAEGTIGFLAPEAEAAVIHAVTLRAPDRPGFESRFEDGDNPLTGGDVGQDGLFLASGVPGKDLVVPLAHPAPLLRRAFAVKGDIVRARLHVAAGGFATVSLNGAPVGQSALATGWTAYDKRVLYQTHDVTVLLKAGDNVLTAELARGWYGITEPNEWYFHKAPWTAEPVLKARLEIILADGSTQALTTDGTWRAADGPCLWDSIYAGERRDARREPTGWREPGFDDHAWDAAVVAKGPAGRLVAAIHEPIAPVARHAAISVKEVRSGVWVFDFGRIRTGVPELSVTGTAGRTVSMVLAEKPRKDGGIQVASGLIDAQLMTWRYTLAGRGRETWRPAFGYGGFRYVQVTGLDGTPSLDTITAVEIHSNVARIGRFECADPLVNTIHDAARQGLLNNLHAAQTDTPSLEKNGWTGDAQASSAAAAVNFDVVRTWEKWLGDFVDAQAASGELPEIVPSTPYYGFENTPGWNYVWGPTPAWDVAAFVLPEELALRFGARAAEPVRALQRRLADYTARFLQAPDYRYDHGLGEYAAAGPTGPVDATSTAYVFHMLKATGQAALAAKVRAAYNARYWDGAGRRYVAPPEGGKPAPYCQTMNVLPVALGLVPDGQAQAVIDGLAADIAAKGHRLDVGVYALRYLPLLLSDHGHGETAWKVVTRTDEPSWGFWLKNDIRSMPEGWGLGSRSWNHHYFASISSWFYEGLAGLRPAAPGYARLRVRPVMPNGLGSAGASQRTPRGEASSRWVRRADGGVTLTVGVPGACEAEIWLPNGGRRLAHPPPGALWRGPRDGHAVYRVGPGSWTFEIAAL